MPKLQLGVIEFGKQLIQTNDLDPIYTMLWKAKLTPITLKKFLLAYFCFYHSGTASWIVDQPNYWAAMVTAAASKDYPRASERRHFRAKAAIESVAWLRGYPNGFDYLMGPITDGRESPLELVMNYVTTWRGFGPWISFKVADMVERLDLKKVNFSDADTFLFDSPREGAEIVVEKYAKGAAVKDKSAWALAYLKGGLGHLDAPPRFERKINGQELETVLCKWKSYLKGSYSIGKDVEELKHALERFRTPTASYLASCL